ncbi:hypothetical protein NDR87_02725 [Nocardia sp. CDC159]|uniref:MarR family transcriptional regulator n=1 Tax=Nocardia pulmonis TaxID=2951408 RepID=A0A9X2IUG7_9NOCA|nr:MULTISPECIES: hypothetical protein [Nocardia]MCM6772073.1 hypothetical protein [Nocardia pulmonis]MCM6785269.1 hypothetical protein [Nocardia sp. CDC159]
MAIDLAVELHRLEILRSTGVLSAGDGAFHITEGAIVRADCRRTTGLDRMVVEAGVATAEDWQRAGAGDPGHVLGRPRLETLALLSVFDAAYFLLAAPSVPEFRSAPPHWLAPVCHIRPATLVDECARRGDPETGPWPARLVDRAPVVPARHIRLGRVALTGGQAEVLAAADGRRSIAAIARDLGRTTYGCLVSVRELTAAGLIEPPTTETAVIPLPRRVSGPTMPTAALPIPASDVTTALPPMAAPEADSPGPAGPMTPARTKSALRSRVSTDSSDRPKPLANSAVRRPPGLLPPERWEPVDRDVLIRLRAALEELR